MVALAGHRDTHFAFLQQVRPGHHLTLMDIGGSATRYVVTGTRVVDQYDVAALDLAPENGLVLVTCYPFTAVAASPNTPWRLLVLAKREGPALASPTAETLAGLHQRRSN
jgi:sortase A